MRKTWVMTGAVLALAACGSPTEPGAPAPIESLPRALTAAEETLIGRSNVFGLRLLAEVAATAERALSSTALADFVAPVMPDTPLLPDRTSL